MSGLDLRRIAGAISQVWAGGSGPGRARIQSALMISGYEGPDEGNKQELVQSAITTADDATARLVIEELLSLLRESGYFNRGGDEELAPLFRSVDSGGHTMDHDGYIRWATELDESGARSNATPESEWEMDEKGPSLNGVATVEVTSPDLELLVSSLRRLGSGATRCVINRRRKSRPGLSIQDEYDMQDLVEMLLRSLYSDVRPEEPTPSSAGSSSRMDLHIRQDTTAIEVKVTRAGRGENQIKAEILVDINDYRGHPTVGTLVVAVYDLGATFENPAGFEHDLSGLGDGLEVRVLVIPWIGPRAPEV